MPCFIAREPDGYCLHLHRQTLLRDVWTTRLLRCRRYACREEREIRIQGLPFKKGQAGGDTIGEYIVLSIMLPVRLPLN